MAIEQEAVVKVRLDLSEAERQIERAKRDRPALEERTNSNRPAQTSKEQSRSDWRSIDETAPRRDALATERELLKRHMKSGSEAGGSSAPVGSGSADRAKRLARKIGMPQGLAEKLAVEGEGMLSRFGAPGRFIAKEGTRFLGPTNFSTLTEGIGGAAAVYGVIKGGSWLAGTASAAVVGAAPDLASNPVFDAMRNQIANLERAVANFESRLGSLSTAADRTMQMSRTAAYLGAGVGDVQHYFKQEQAVAVQEADLAKAFDRFKRNKVAQEVGRSFSELFKSGMHF